MDDFRISDMKRLQKEDSLPPLSRQGRGPESDTGSAVRNIPIEKRQLLEDVTLRQYWEIVLRYRTVVICITLAVFIVSFASSYLSQEKYKARVEILRKEERPRSVYGMDIGSKYYYLETLAKIAVSRPVFENAAALITDALEKFEADGHKIPDEDWQTARESSAQVLPATIKAITDEDSSDILCFESVSEKSRFIVAAVANAVARSFINRLSEIDRKEATQRCIILEGLQEAKQKELHDIETEILDLRRKHEEKEETFTAIAADERRLLDLVSEYEMLFQENKLKKEEIQEQVKAIKHELGVDGIPTDGIHWVDMSNITEKRLQELKLKRAELLTRYTRENSLVTRIDSQIKAMESIVTSPAKKAGRQKRVTVDFLRSKMVTDLILLESRLRGTSTKLVSIKKMRDDLNKKLIELPIKTLKIERLKRQKEVLEKLSDELRHSYQQEKIASKGKVADIEIIEPAVPPDGPFYPNKKKTGIMGFLCGLFLGVAAAFLLDHWDNSINTTREIKNNLNIYPLGLIPVWQDDDKFINPAGVDDVNAEVYGVLRNNIRYSNTENPEKCLLIASAVQSEGKSLTAVNLACSFSFEGNRTLLVAMDLRHKRDYYGLRPYGAEKKRGGKGMGNFLAGEAEYSDIIYETNFENLYVLPTGGKRKNPARLLNPSKLNRLFRDMERQFDVVILDAPAVLPVVDSTIISPLVRGVLLVVAAGKTPIGACQQAISRLEHVNSQIIGAVLNKTKDMRFDFFYGAGYSYYYKGYRKEKR